MLTKINGRLNERMCEPYKSVISTACKIQEQCLQCTFYDVISSIFQNTNNKLFYGVVWFFWGKTFVFEKRETGQSITVELSVHLTAMSHCKAGESTGTPSTAPRPLRNTLRQTANADSQRYRGNLNIHWSSFWWSLLASSTGRRLAARSAAF